MCDEDSKEVDVTLSGEWDVNLKGGEGGLFAGEKGHPKSFRLEGANIHLSGWEMDCGES